MTPCDGFGIFVLLNQNQMKHLITCLALGIAIATGAQTGLVEFPYNPDADNDDIIGVNDLMALLGLYATEFSEEALYLNDDETSALFWTGVQNFAMCKATCSDLPGRWKMINMDDWSHFHNEVESVDSGNLFAWLSNLEYSKEDDGFPLLAISRADAGGWPKGGIATIGLGDNTNCFCATHERPKVEYSYCRGEYPTDPFFQTCADENVENGWYPLGGIEVDAGQDAHQAFWRWAE